MNDQETQETQDVVGQDAPETQDAGQTTPEAQAASQETPEAQAAPEPQAGAQDSPDTQPETQDAQDAAPAAQETADAGQAQATQEASQPPTQEKEPTQEKKEGFGDILAAFEKDAPAKREGPAVGGKVSGKILSLGEEWIFVDLGAKAEGRIG